MRDGDWRAKVQEGQVDREAKVRAGTVTSARDEIWIDMMQFDVRAADRLWEGIPPAEGAPGWYDDVSGLIETANGPAEPHELVDEPVVVEGMHQTTLARPRCRRHHGRTVGRVIAMKAAAATAASVLGVAVAAAAAATTGIVTTMARVVAPVIEEHVLAADDDEHEPATPAPPPAGAAGGSSDTGLDGQPMGLGAAPLAFPAPAPSPQPADPEPPEASVSAAPTAPAVEAVARVAPPPQADPPPVASAPVEAASAEPKQAAKSLPADPRPDKVVPPRDAPASPDASHGRSGSGRTHKGALKAERNAAVGGEVAERAEQRRPAHSRRQG
jgi:hypothetical protein